MIIFNWLSHSEQGIHHHLPETRGLCLFEEQAVSTILRRPISGFGNQVVEMMTEPYKLIRRREVTAILVLCRLPRLLHPSPRSGRKAFAGFLLICGWIQRSSQGLVVILYRIRHPLPHLYHQKRARDPNSRGHLGTSSNIRFSRILQQHMEMVSELITRPCSGMASGRPLTILC